jgi:hypothetical protein
MSLLPRRARRFEGTVTVKRPFVVAALLLALASSAFAQAPASALKAPIAQKPALITTVGQSADIEMVKTVFERAAVPFKADPQAKAAGLAASGAKTLVLVLGGSTKGMGAAGISTDTELARTTALLAEAKKLGLTVIGLHIGGEARRGPLSDAFIQAAVPACHYVIVVAEGDKDGFITRLCGSKIPLDKVERTSKTVEPIQKAFK